MAPSNQLPGPRAPDWLAALRSAADPLGFYPKLAARHGPLFAISFPGFPSGVAVADAELAQAVTSDAATFPAGEANRLVFEPLDGERSVVTADGGAHRRLRHALAPAASWGRRNRELIRERFERQVAGWPLGRPFAVRPRAEAAVLDLVLRGAVGVGTGDAPELAAAVRRLARRARPILNAPAVRRNLGPASPWQRFLRARAQLDELLAPLLASPPGADCALAALSKPGAADGGGLAREELRDQVVTLLMAGYEGTATAIAWAFERLAAHPGEVAAARAQAEGDARLDLIARETLRVRPPFNQIWRIAAHDAELGGHHVPAGSLVVIAIAAIHVQPASFPEPERFLPERHAGGPPGGWMPFGGGVRACLGATTAREMTVAALAAALGRGRLEAASQRPERPVLRGGTVEPLRGGRVVLREG